MIRFKKLSIKNFLSYGNAPINIELDTIGTTLIVGEDLDNTSSGTGANGVGKTTWVNALIFGLYGKPISNISLDNLVNNINKKDMRVEVEFEVGNNIIMVRRARKEKGNGNYAKVFVRGLTEDLDEQKHDQTPDSVANINDFVEGYLGIPYELFIRIVTFTATHTPFLDLPLRQQSDMMEELFSLTQLSIKAEALKKEIKDTKQNLEIKTKHNEQLEKEHERYNSQIETADSRVNDWNENQQEVVINTQVLLDEQLKIPVEEQEKIHNELAELSMKVVSAKEKLRDIKDELKNPEHEQDTLATELSRVVEEKSRVEQKSSEYETEVQDSVDVLKNEVETLRIVDVDEQLDLLEQLETVEKELSTADESFDAQVAEMAVLNTKWAELEEERAHLEDAKCPYCLQDYEGAKTKLTKYSEDIINVSGQVLTLDGSSSIISKEITKLTKKRKRIKDKIQFNSKELLKIVSDLENKEERLQMLLDEKNPYAERLQEFKDFNERSMKADINKLEKVIALLTTKISKQTTVVEATELKIDRLRSKVIIQDISELYEIKNKIEGYKTKLVDLENETNPYLAPLKELQEMKLEPIDMDTINDLDNLITHQNYLVKLLTKKDSFIRKNLLNKNLLFLNQRLHHYLSALGLPHKVEFTQEMTANITQFGRELDFGNLSSGQKARVNLGLAFSFRDVLQQSHDSINVCMLDEVLDVGLDTVGVQNAARMLKHKAREEDLALYIISHRDEVSNIFDNRMVVQMEKGFSSVKVEE